ncbi:MAG: PD40 domain-containing protein [Planctomycetes bacterium]|nr:PD40 domain-containing protein [Planctomycetota bacterium]
MRSPHESVARASVLCAACVLVAGARDAAAQVTARASVSTAGFEANDHSLEPALSADGRWIAFSSTATALVGGDSNGVRDVFVHDRLLGTTSRASSTSSGAEAHGSSESPALSRDGLVLSFDSFASDLVTGDANGFGDVFVRDLATGATECASRNALGLTANARSSWSSLSGDGRFVVFLSEATDLVLGNPAFSSQVFVRDRQTGSIELASRDSSGVIGDGNCFDRPVLSADARYVAFASWASNLVVGDTNATSDVFVRDRLTGSTERVSISSAQLEADSSTRWPAMTPDGRFVAFQGPASNLSTPDHNVRDDVFVRDRLLGTTRCASLTPSFTTGDHWSRWPSISDDGLFVAFLTNTSDILAGDVPGTVDGALRDFSTLTTTKLDFVWNGASLPPAAGLVLLSGDARVAAFPSGDPGYVLGDVNGWSDVFTVDRFARATPPYTTYCTAKTNSSGCSPRIGASGIASTSALDSLRIVAVDVLATKNGLLIWGLGAMALPFGGGTLCVQPPLKRTSVQNSGGASPCGGAYSFAFDQAYMASKGVGAGAVLFAQFWSRDPGFAPPDDIGLTNALAFSVLP